MTAPTPTNQRAALRPGTRLGPYEVQAPLGAGGMGEVYRARDERLGREVAVKVLTAEALADPDRLRRFEQEARAAGALNHPNLLTVFDTGQHEGNPYVVFELLEGATLRQVVGRAALPARKAVDYAVQIAQGLAAAHEKGIVHRDLKPENLFVTKDGRVKILDFGLAKLRPAFDLRAPREEGATISTATGAGVVLGTVGYMSPEQVRGDPADHRSDIFAFGAVFHEMLSGERPFRGETTAEVMTAILKEDSPELATPDVPPGLARVVRRCLEKRPEERFQSARDIGFALESAATAANPFSIDGAPVRRPRHGLLQMATAAMLGGAVVLGGALWKWPRAPEPPSFKQVTFRRASIAEARFAPDGQTIFYGAAVEGRHNRLFSARLGSPEVRALDLPDGDIAAISASGDMAIVLSHSYISRVPGTLARVSLAGGAPRDLAEKVSMADWGPDGRDLAVVRHDGVKRRLEYPIGKVLYESDRRISFPRVSPRGDRVAFLEEAGPTALRVVDLSGKTTTLVAAGDALFGLAWSPKGDEVWFTEWGLIRAVTLGGAQRILTRVPGPITINDVSSDGRVLVTMAQWYNGLVVAGPGEARQRDLAWFEGALLAALSRDGDTVLFTDRGLSTGSPFQSHTYLRRTDGSPAVRLGEGTALSISPDGKWALSRLRGPSRCLLLPTGPGESRPLPTGDLECEYASWFPDGSRLLVVGKEQGRPFRLFVQDLDGRQRRGITPEGLAVNYFGGIAVNDFGNEAVPAPVPPLISPDGKLVAVKDAQGHFMLFPVEGGEPRQAPGTEPREALAGWSADSQSLYVYPLEGDVPVRIDAIDLRSGHRHPLKEITPPDAQAFGGVERVMVTPDGKAYAYQYGQSLCILYVIEGLRDRFMPVESGVRLGPYEVLSPLGAGGMGEVYRARDERLGREVAVKVLPSDYSSDPDRLRRFEQEAKAAGALNHPNLVAVFDTGQHDGNPYVVFELLDGVTLRQRLGPGPLPVRKAVEYAVQIAQGLAAAHEKGIVHRDLKPENLFVTRDGRVKILDFGLAKLRPTLDPDAPRTEDGSVATATGAGVVLGTVGYMSPEQVRGDPADHRSDIFAFGSVLYEMLSGRRPFSGETAAEVMTAILKADPLELASLDVPAGLEQVVRRCLEKRPEERFQSVRDIGFALEAVSSGSGSRPSTVIPALRRRRRLRGLVAAALLLGTLIAAFLLGKRTGEDLAPAAVGVTRFTWSLPAGMDLDSAPVVSPDSRSIAFTATDASGTRLFVRALDRLEASAVAGTEGAKQPFWSPDSRSLGYFANGALMKVALASGAPVRICDAPEARGGTWSRSGVIVFAPALIHFALTRVSAEGGPAEPATVLDVSQGENSHRWPVFLPDGVHFLYFVRSSVDERRGVYLARVDRPASRPASPLFRSESEAVYAPLSGRDRGVLLSVANGRVAARPFDDARLALDGDPRMIDLPAGGNTLQYPAMLGASVNLLAAVSSPIPSGSRLASSGRNGEDPRFWKERETQFWPRLSPDGRRLARQRIDVLRGDPALWVEDLERGTRVRVATIGLLPVWSPDGSRLAYLTGTRAEPHLSVVAADGTGDVAILPCPRAFCEPTDWSPDGGRLLVNVRDDHDRGGDVWAVSTNQKGSAQPLLAEAFTERDARLSPDGRWIAYVSEESGRAEVSVRSVSGPLRRIVISGDGGDQPVWRRDGAELFFVDPQGRLRAVAVSPGKGASLTVGVPVELKVPPIPIGQRGTQYDVSPDGRRVYFLDRTLEPAPREISVVLGWRALLRTASRQAEAGN